MDQVVQSNAATAEESASASQEMSSQVIVINQVVGTLTRLIGIRRGNSGAAPAQRPGPDRIEPENRVKMLAASEEDLGDF